MSEGGFQVPIALVPRAHSRSILINCAVFLGLAWMTVGLRFYTRVRIVRAVGWDDGSMLVTALFFTVLTVCASALTYLIDERTSLPEGMMTTSINLLLVAEIFYVLTMMALKASLALFFLRIIVEKWQRRVIYYAITISTVFSSVYFFYAVFQCGVPRGTSFWINKLSGKCAGTGSILGLGYTHALVNALTDLTFVALCVPMLAKVRISLREKIIVGGIFFLASVGCIASFVRLPWIRTLAVTDTGFFTNLLWLTIWSTVEPGLGIIAASLATLRPLLRKIEPQFSSLQFTSSRSNLSSRSKTSSTFHSRNTSRNKLSKTPKQMQHYFDSQQTTSGLSTVESIEKDASYTERSERGDRAERENVMSQSSMVEGFRKEIAHAFRANTTPEIPNLSYQPNRPAAPTPYSSRSVALAPSRYQTNRVSTNYSYPYSHPVEHVAPGKAQTNRTYQASRTAGAGTGPYQASRYHQGERREWDAYQPARPERREREVRSERRLAEDERPVVKNSPWRPTMRKKKGSSWLPLALFGSKSSLERFEYDTEESDGPSDAKGSAL